MAKLNRTKKLAKTYNANKENSLLKSKNAASSVSENMTYKIYFKSGNSIKIKLRNRSANFLQSYTDYLESGSPTHIVKHESYDGGQIAILWSQVEVIHELWDE